MSRDYNVIIIGTGPAGFSCAMQSSKFNKSVLAVESHSEYLGGTWINSGTVPSKALREAAKTIQEFNDQFHDDQTQKPYERFKMQDLLQYKQEILEKENKKVKNDLIKNKVDVTRGFGKIVDEHTVEIETHFGTTETYSADYILACTGSSPKEPTHFEVDHDKILDYKSILELTHIPRRMAIIGSGVHAIEYATIFSALGTRVTILSRRSQLLPFLDEEILESLRDILEDKKINLRTNTTIQKIDFNSIRNYTELRFKSGQEPDRLQVLETEHVLYLGGREPNVKGLGLDKAGVKTNDRNYITVDNDFKTNIDSIYAAGDVIGFPKLTSTSFTEGRLAACNMFDIPAMEVPKKMPYAIYGIPEVSTIGLTEKQANQRGIDASVGRAHFENIAKADMANHTDGMLKLVFETESLKLLGVHIIGDDAANLIHLGQSVISFEGDVRYFINHVMNYPTLSEAYRIAAFNGVNRVFKAGVKYQDILEDEQ